MARFERIDVINRIREKACIPVFYHSDKEICREVLTACYEGGLRLFELTNRGDYAQDVFADLYHFTIKNYPDMMLGVGSVIDAPTAALFMQMGADFVVSPLLNPETAKVCNRRKVLWIPGCGSVSEISQAEELGAEIIKIFPGAAVGGPGFVKAVKGPMPWTSLMPTSGVEPSGESIEKWFASGVVAVGLGSQLFTKDMVAGKKWDELTISIRQLTEWVNRYK